MWYFKDKIFDVVLEEFDSFVYLIERLNIEEDSESPQYYIGKKTFYNKSKYKGKRIIVESDWWDYYGSSEWLLEHVEKYGKENFKRNIIHLCRTRGDAGYLEVYEQMKRNVLHRDPDGYKPYYNKDVSGKYREEPDFYVFDSDIVEDYLYIDESHGSKVWVTNSKQNRLVSKSIGKDLVDNSHWVYGRTCKGAESSEVEPTKNLHCNYNRKVIINNSKEQKWVFTHDLHSYLKAGWVQKPLPNKTKETLITETFDDKIFANDIFTGEKVLVSKTEYKNNKNLTSVKTKQVKIKRKNRIVFKGYLEAFCSENKNFTKSFLMRCLKDETGEFLDCDNIEWSIRYI
jgi:hypothetical protein